MHQLSLLLGLEQFITKLSKLLHITRKAISTNEWTGGIQPKRDIGIHQAKKRTFEFLTKISRVKGMKLGKGGGKFGRVEKIWPRSRLTGVTDIGEIL